LRGRRDQSRQFILSRHRSACWTSHDWHTNKYSQSYPDDIWAIKESIIVVANKESNSSISHSVTDTSNTSNNTRPSCSYECSHCYKGTNNKAAVLFASDDARYNDQDSDVLPNQEEEEEEEEEARIDLEFLWV